jgi:outer membrane protein OmpA-like peptidoglycan-associated protein
LDASVRFSCNDCVARWALGALVALGVVALAGCTDENPFDAMVKHVDQPIPGANQPYPNLASVPDKAPTVTSKDERATIQQSLASDNQHPGAPTAMIASPPPIPAPPAALPPGFAGAQSPMKLPDAQAGSANPSDPNATLAPGTPSFGAMGRPDRVAVVLFTARSDGIDPAEIGLLKPLAGRLRARGGTLQVVGHAAADPSAADSAKDKIASFDLSLLRAQAVARALRGFGVSPDEMIVSAEGDSAPVPALDGIEGAPANDRVDIYLEN